MSALDIIIPVFNEDGGVVLSTVLALKKAFAGREDVRIIVVDDGSHAELKLDGAEKENVVLLRHESNRGYGSSLKTGIMHGDSEWIAIIDADGTYPAEELQGLVDEMGNADMVVGIRTGQVREIPLIRRFPKYLLNSLASYMAGVKIKDLNSGMRVFSRDLCIQLWNLFPRRYSFTSTLTMGAHMGGYRIREKPINYHKRIGRSSISPIRDTLHFLHIIIRMGVLFHPMKFFGPIAAFLIAMGVLKGFVRDILVIGYIGNLAVMLILSGVQILFMGYLGELIVSSRFLSQREQLRRDR
jgi:glycosyltransferase involved in cell wall biosynthesis